MNLKLKYLSLTVLIILSSCGINKNRNDLIEKLTERKWNCKIRTFDNKEYFLTFPNRNKEFKVIADKFWPLLLSDCSLEFKQNNFEFKNDEFSIKGNWIRKNDTLISFIGEHDINNDTLNIEFYTINKKTGMKIEKSRVINMESKEEIEIFYGNNIIFDLEEKK